MTSKKLQRARDFEKKYSPYVVPELPKFHVTGAIGWINDPNGFAPYKGEYHLFYQYHPYDTKWGPMHWGHVKTKDFVSWERLPIALAPDMDYDKDGCFSGGAVEMPDGRHLPNQRFMGMMTLPRELSIRNGRLCQNPVRELENYRSVKIAYQNVMMTGEVSLQGINGRFIDMTVTIRPGNEASMYRWFKINVARDGEHFTSIRFKPATGIVRIDRTQSGLPCDIVNIREFPVHSVNGALKLRLVMDRYSVELFINDGEQAATSMIYTPLDAKSISFSCDGTVLVDVENTIWRYKPWPRKPMLSPWANY